jgi:hypothetical protein
MERELSKSVARDEDDLQRVKLILMNKIINKAEKINKAAAAKKHAVNCERFMDPIEGRYALHGSF